MGLERQRNCLPQTDLRKMTEFSHTKKREGKHLWPTDLLHREFTA